MGTQRRTIDPQELLGQLGWVQGLARRLVGDANAADDLSQETLRVAWEKPPGPSLDGAGLRAWLGALTRRLARDQRRSSHRRRARERASRGAPEASPSTFEVVERAASGRRIARLVMELEEPYRSTLLYRYFDGLDAARVAELMSATPAAVRQRAKRALDSLRAQLDRDTPGGREAWLAALAPLAAPTPVTTAFAQATGTGIVMSSLTKISIVALVAAGGLWWPTRTDPAPRAEPEGVPSHVAEARAEPASATAPGQRSSLALGTVTRAPQEQSAPPQLSPARSGPAGRVLDEAGQPVGGAEVLLAPPSLPAKAREAFLLFGPGHRAVSRTRTDKSGRFRLEPPPDSGSWRVWAGTARRFWAHTDPFDGDVAPDLELILHDLPADRYIAGEVRAADGSPVAGAELSAAQVAAERTFAPWGESDPDGHFVLPVPSGFQIDLRAEHARHGTRTLEGLRGGQHELVLTLRTRDRLELRATDSEGVPLRAFTVRIRPLDETFPSASAAIEDVDGRGTVDLPDRDYVVEVRADGYREVEVGPFAAESRSQLDVSLRKLATVSGRVTAGGLPVERAVVQLVRSRDPAGREERLYGFPDPPRRARARRDLHRRPRALRAAHSKARFLLPLL